jgi:hypothetical protein
MPTRRTRSSSPKEQEMTTAETAKLIRTELKTTFPTIKFSVRKIDCGVINIEFKDAKEIRSTVDSIAKKFEGWSEFNTQFVFVNCYGNN